VEQAVERGLEYMRHQGIATLVSEVSSNV